MSNQRWGARSAPVLVWTLAASSATVISDARAAGVYDARAPFVPVDRSTQDPPELGALSRTPAVARVSSSYDDRA